MMAKDKSEKKGKKDKSEKSEKTAAPEFKFGVSDLASALDIEPASVRVQLRNHKIEKAGKSYGWNTQKDLDEVVKTLKAGKSGGKKEKGDKKEKKEKKSKKDD
jgi:hypothetical protein